MYEPRDEISLRELYLIFRSGFLAILLVALAAGAAAFLYLSSQADRYEASATVQLNVPTADSSSEEAAWLLPAASIGMNSYTAIANRRDVVASAFNAPVGNVEELRQLANRLELNAIDAQGQARGQLTVTHRASATTPEEAAQIANTWAQTTAAAVTSAMSHTVNANAEASARQLAQRETELAAARQLWTQFAQHDQRASLSSEINVQLQLHGNALLRIAQLDNLIVSSRAQSDLLQAALDSRSGASSRSLQAQLEALVASGALDDATKGLLERTLSQLPAGLTAGSQDLLTLVTRTQVESLAGNLAAYAAERDLLQRTLGNSESKLSDLRTKLADLNQEAETVQAQLSAAQRAYDSVAALSPLIKLQQGMIGSAARVVVAAEPPLMPQARNTLTITLASLLVAGLLATLVVFLRAAIREPEKPLPPQAVAAHHMDIDRVSGSPKHTGEFTDAGPLDTSRGRRPEERLADER